MEDHQYVLSFWFGDAEDDAEVARRQSDLWWKKSADTDQLIWAKFEHRVLQARDGQLTAWLQQPESRLACILLIDQFCRHIYRDTPDAWSHDPLALGWCREGIDRGDDRQLRPIERAFFYMPLEHAESLEDQHRSVALFEELLAQSDGEARPTFQGFLDHARRHRKVIERFGRYPHRNAILGRSSTEEERAFLERPGSRF